MMKKHILLLEDDLTLGRGVCFALENEQTGVTTCATLREAKERLAGAAFDLLILDVSLPDGSGLELLREVRRSGCGVPVILLTANDLETDIVMGLESGADDYVTKPFSLAVLRARVNAQLRRGPAAVTDAFRQGEYVFDFAGHRFTKAGRIVELSKTEQKLLRLLVSNRGLTLSREVLIERVWTAEAVFVEENALSVTVNRLRGKLEDDPAKPRYLKTTYGVGYTWAVK